MDYTREQYEKDLLKFRNIMCSTKFTLLQKDDALNGLINAWMETHLDQEDSLSCLTRATMIEWTRRREYEVNGT
jgi:hypothetical protein